MTLDEDIQNVFSAHVAVKTDELSAEQIKALHEIDVAYYTALVERIDTLVLGSEQASVAYYNLANALIGSGQFAEAIHHYQKALELQPYTKLYLRRLGDAYYLCDRFDDAAQTYSSVVNFFHDYGADLLNKLHDALDSLGHFDDSSAWSRETTLSCSDNAFSALQNGYASNEKNPEFCTLFAFALTLKGEYTEALRNLNHAIDLNPELPSAYAHRSDLNRIFAGQKPRILIGQEPIRNSLTLRHQRFIENVFIPSALQDIAKVFELVEAKGDKATERDYKAVVRAAYNKGILDKLIEPLYDQRARQAVLQHPLV